LYLRVSEDVAAPGNLEFVEPCVRQLGRKLCFQQSADDSTYPQFDV